jgi:CDP-paratose 2-epimerase
LAFREGPTRFSWTGDDGIPGVSSAGIAEEFPLEGPRSLYGATKLAGEVLLQEYAASFHMPVLINRCGVLAGPWQMGKADQGVVTLWVARHIFEQDLSYFGYGGSGKQVRDVLHVDDLIELVRRQLERPSLWDGRVYNVGGGLSSSASLVELTEMCRAISGRRPAVHRRDEPSPSDLRIYISDCRRAEADFQWRPRAGVNDIAQDVAAWIRANEDSLRGILA